MAANILLYLKRFENGNISPLLKDAFNESRSLNYKHSWVTKALALKNKILKNVDQIPNRKHLNKIMTSQYNEYWRNKIQTEPKMRTYRTIKNNFKLEEYLTSVPKKYRKDLTRFRISAHNLAIERGRYTRPPTPLENRTCPNCPDKVENEFHFLLECPMYKEGRQEMVQNIEIICPNFKLLNMEEQFIFLMNAEGKFTEIISKFISNNIK